MKPLIIPDIIDENSFARSNSFDPESEYVSRILARQNLLDLTTYTYPKYVPEAFHIQLASALDQVIEGEITRLMVFAPPQHGKSELTSVRLPARWIATQPNQPIILASYNASLAWEKTASIWSLVYSRHFQNLYPELFKEKSGSGRKLILKNPRSVIYAAGVRGAITGRGGLLGIIDDPVKDWREAYSQSIRNSTWDWWKGTFRTRIWNKGRIVIIMTRWHEDDLAGRILNHSGEKWTVLRYPAIAETEEEKLTNRKYIGNASDIFTEDPLKRKPGEPLCPLRYPIKALLDIKHDIGPRPWAAEYQATPRPQEGNHIKIEHIHVVNDFPRGEITKYVRYWDKAGTEGGGARTAGVLLAVTKDRVYYIVDVVTGQWSPFKREEIIKTIAEKDSFLYAGKVETFFEREGGSEGLFGAAYTIRNLAGLSIHPDRPSGSKEARFELFSSQMEAGNVFIVKGEWNLILIDELLSFPNGTYKDQCDALSGAFKKIVLTGWSRAPGA